VEAEDAVAAVEEYLHLVGKDIEGEFPK